MIIITMNKNQRAESSTARQNKSGQTKQTNNNINKNKKKRTKSEIVMAPTAMSNSYVNVAPSLNYSVKGDGSVRIRHREYVKDIVTNGAGYASSGFSINPGNNLLFAWLQAIALSYESYIFNSLSFEFESTCATTDRGTLLMGIDFDASDAPPTTKQQLMAYHGSVRANVWTHCCCLADSKDLRKFGVQRYVRTAAPLTGQSVDVKTYDVGNFYIATQGTPVGITVGELYVTYDVTLHTPQPAGLGLLYGYSARFGSNDAVSMTQPMGLSFTNQEGGLSVSWRSTNSFFINTIGQYLVEVIYSGSGFDTTDIISLLVPFGGTSPGQSGWHVGPDGLSIMNVALVDVTQVGCYCQLAFTSSSPTSYTIRIAPFPSHLI